MRLLVRLCAPLPYDLVIHSEAATHGIPDDELDTLLEMHSVTVAERHWLTSASGSTILFLTGAVPAPAVRSLRVALTKLAARPHTTMRCFLEPST